VQKTLSDRRADGGQEESCVRECVFILVCVFYPSASCSMERTYTHTHTPSSRHWWRADVQYLYMLIIEHKENNIWLWRERLQRNTAFVSQFPHTGLEPHTHFKNMQKVKARKFSEVHIWICWLVVSTNIVFLIGLYSYLSFLIGHFKWLIISILQRIHWICIFIVCETVYMVFNSNISVLLHI